MAREDHSTPAGQPYTLITVPAFASNILKALKHSLPDIKVCVKDLNKILKGRAPEGIATESTDDEATDEEAEGVTFD